MTDEGMKLLKEAAQYLQQANTLALLTEGNNAGLTPLLERIDAYLATGGKPLPALPKKGE